MIAELAQIAVAFAPGRELDGGKYRLIRKLGAGGMGEVFEAENTPISGDVADNEDVGACSLPCDWDTHEGCKPGTICAQLLTGLACHVQLAECPLYDNNVCDEHTRICREGTDSDADCER